MKHFAVAAPAILAVLILAAFAHDKLADAAPATAALAQLPGNARPLVCGEFLSGTLWEKPVTHTVGSNAGHSPASGARVDVYGHKNRDRSN